MKLKGAITMDEGSAPEEWTFNDLVAHYFAHKKFRKQSTRDLHEQVINGVLVPRWGNRTAINIKPIEIKRWLSQLDVEDPTRAKYRSIMGTVYTFAQCESLLPLRLEYNVVHYVKGFSAVSDYEAMTLEPEQTYRVLEQLHGQEYALLFLIAATGMRMSEALGLRWADVLWEKGQIKIRQTYVHNIMQDRAKTKLPKSSVELHPLLASVLRKWRVQTPYGRPQD